ncbi:MAG: NADP-dependent malic enzyme [Patescibacteria group bacterium]|jgi:malate dehydrogenase (oxaloacetate-decarboxylating)|nr:NADP-dependent malic enzyme [Patescibacteria group bacterium]
MNIYDESLTAHLNSRGKIGMVSRVPLNSIYDLSVYYSPGVAAVSRRLTDHPDETALYTNTHNSVAIVSDGSAVLGLGNIGPRGALPVMEGKAILFKHFADIDGFPIVLDTQDPDRIIDIVSAIAPSFGGINLEDIAAPNCFYIEDELKKRLSIPIMHDDQHGTAIVVLAGLINAARVTGRRLSDCKIVLIGAGAAGVAVAKLIKQYANPVLIAVDSKGVINKDRPDLNKEKQLLASYSNNDGSTSLEEALKDADIFIGVSRGGLLNEELIKSMSKNPIIFALANPEPEIMPDLAKRAGAAVIATGRSDFPNQVNNVLAFPGIFRGALDNKVKIITENHKIEAAEALAYVVRQPSQDQIIPNPFDEKVMQSVASVFSSK